MELQKFIDNNTNYTSVLRELNLNFKKYSELGLLIISYKYNVKYNLEQYPFIKWCRGAIVRLSDNKVICLPVQKALIKYNLNDDISLDNDDNCVLQPLIDGTMINIFNHNDEWLLSTRNFIGARNKWDGNLSFKKMFDSIVLEKDINLDLLNKENSYTFVLQHKDNRIISDIVDNNIILVDEYSVNDNKFLDLEGKDYGNIVIIKNNDLSVLNNSFKKTFNYQFKGFTLKYSDKRINYINENYDSVLSLKNECNFNNKLLTFLYLRNNNKLTAYLKYFRNDDQLFDSYRNKIYLMKNELHSCYCNYFIKKSINKKDIPYHLKPLVYDLHSIYKKSGTKITISVVNDYLYNLPIKKLCFVINYYLV